MLGIRRLLCFVPQPLRVRHRCRLPRKSLENEEVRRWDRNQPRRPAGCFVQEAWERNQLRNGGEAFAPEAPPGFESTTREWL